MPQALVIQKVLPAEHIGVFSTFLAKAVITWKEADTRLVEPSQSSRKLPKHWDNPAAKLKKISLIDRAPNDLTCGRLLVAGTPKAGVWLNAIPVPALGLKLDNEGLRIAVALRLGAKLNSAYNCACGIAIENHPWS